MASHSTPNYQLNQWEATDQVVRTEFNADNLKVDQTMKALENRAQNNAQQLQGLSTQFQGHTQQLQGLSAQLQTLSQQLQAKGNCTLVLGSYVGTGSSGNLTPNRLTFSTPPQGIFISGTFQHTFAIRPGSQSLTTTTHGSPRPLYFQWGSHDISWYAGDPTMQLNLQNQIYYYIALFIHA